MKQAAPQQKGLTPPVPARQNGLVKKTRKPFFSAVSESPLLVMGPADSRFEKEANAVAGKLSARNSDDRVRASALQKSKMPAAENENEPISRDIRPRISAVIDSPGRPLDESIRRQMESFFNDSFSQIRIHDDRQANESSALLSARAYTYGNHIVFAANAYQPHSLQGKKLIAHELTHTIQQEGGDVLIQRDPHKSIADKEEVKTGFTKTIPDLETILAIHKKASPAITAFANKILQVYKQNNIQGYFEQYVEKLAHDKIISSEADPEMDLLFDIYKQNGKNKEAAQLAKKKKYIPQKTAFYSADFYKEVLKDDLSWLPGHPLLSKYYPGPFLDTFLMYLYGPDIKIQSQDIDAIKKKQAEMITVINSGGLIDNERSYIAIHSFIYLDDFRNPLLANLQQKYKSGDPFKVKMAIAKWFVDIDPEKFNEAVFEEIPALLKPLTPKIKKVAGDALAFWNGIIEASKRLSKNDLAKASVAAQFARHKDKFKDFERLIANAALTYLNLTWEGDIPTGGIYEKQRKDALELITVLIKNASLDLIRSTRNNEKEIPSLFGYLIYYLDDVRLLLLPPAKKDTIQANEQIINRLGFATAIGNLAFLLGSAQLSEIAREVKSPTGKRIFGGIQKDTFIAWQDQLSWDQEKLSASQSLRLYMEENMQVEYSPGMAVLMNYFFVNAAMQEEIMKLRGIKELQNDSKGIEIDLMTATRDNYVPIPTRIHESMNAMSQSDKSVIPRRFVLHGAYFSVIPKYKLKFSDFIYANPRFKQELQLRFPNDFYLSPMDVQTHLKANGIVVWDISGDSLKNFAAAMMKLFPAISIPINFNDHPLGWWDAFLLLVKDAESDKHPRGWKSILPDLKGMEASTSKSLKESEKLLNIWRRKALSYHRRVMVRLVIRPLWDAYKENISGIDTWQNPEQAIDQMINLAGAHPYILDALGNEELKMQIAAAMLETGQLIYDRLLDMSYGAMTTHVSMVSKLLPHVAGAISLEQELAKNRDTMLLEYPAAEHEKRVEVLRNLQKKLTPLLEAGYQSKTKDFYHYEKNEVNVEHREVGDWLQGNKGSTELKDLNSTETFDTKTMIQSEGLTYNLVKVNADFRYRPAVAVEAGGVKWDEKMLGNINPSVLIRRNGQGMNPVARDDRKGEILFSYLIIDKNAKITLVDVRDTDDEGLKKIYSLIYVYSANVNLGILADVLETGIEWVKLPFYFIPGLGEMVMAADLVVGILQFLASPEFRTLKDLLMNGDGEKLLKKSFDMASSFFSIEGLWDKLLDENFEIPKFNTPEPETKQGSEINEHSSGRLMKFVHAIANFGKKLWNGVSSVKSLVNYGLKEIHTFILNRPMLAAVISAITNNYYLLQSAIDKGKSLLGLEDEGKEKVEDPSPFSHLIASIPEQLAELRVPLNLVPLDSLMDLIVRMALKLLKGPEAIIADSVKKILEEAGLYQKILDLITEKLSGTDLDPNTYINDFINSKVQPIVQKAGNFFADEITEVFGIVPELKKVPAPNKPVIGELKASGETVEDEHETQPFPGPSFNLEAPLLLPAHPSNGKPLNKSHRQELEEKYGQDFSHVRLHNDGEADQATREMGAEALATGSHVYLRDGLSPDTDPGNKILKHELAHVVQQTGSRPASENHSDKPVDGKPGKGIVFDSGKEAEANTFADGRLASNQLSVSHSGDQGQGAIHPLFGDVPLKFFKTVSKEPEGPSPTEKIFQSSFGARLTDADRILKANISMDLKLAFANIGELKLHKRLGTDKELISEYLKGQLDSKDEDFDFGNLVRLSKVKKSGGKGSDEKTWQVDEKRLSVALKEIIAIKSGIMTDFVLKIVGEHIKLSSVSVNDVYLDKIRRGTNIWEKVILNTFTSPTKSARLATKFTKTANNISNYSDAAKKVILASKYERVFAAEGFRLSDHIAKTTEDMTNPDTTDLATGTKEDPIPIFWYKNTTVDYPQKIWLRLENKDYPMTSGQAVTFKRTERVVQIGVDPGWIIKASHGHVEPGATVFQRASTDRGSLEVNNYRQALLELGYDMKAKDMDVDHVTDLAFGGADNSSNMWPLHKSINRIAYDDKWYKRYKVEYKVGTGNNATREIITLFDARGKWFAIRGYSHDPENETPGGRWTKND